MPSFAHVLSERAQSAPDALAITFRGDPGAGLTYGLLHRRAAALAARIRAVARPGDRAVLLLPPGPDYVAAFFGCLYAGVIAVPTYPPLDDRQIPRLVSVLVDATPTALLTLGGLVGPSREALAEHGVSSALEWVPVDEVEGGEGVALESTAEDIAFLQYTSGSTSSPKGTVVTHGNLLDNSAAIRAKFGHGPDSVGVIWLPPYHDMGLIGGILQPIYTGFPVVLMSPLEFLASPRTWLAAVSEHRATTSGGPNFAFDLCVRKIAPEQREGLDLSHWSVAFCGAEPVREDTLARFTEAFEPHGFSPSAWYPCYGLAESTLIATGGVKGAGVRRWGGAVSCGTPIPGHRVEVLPPGGTTPVEDGEIGEVCVSGPSVAKGYWNNPDATAATFVDGRLRTGDLGFLHDGELHVTGRLKDVVVVRGRNLVAEDVEHELTGCHPLVRPGGIAAFEVDLGTETGLAVLVEVVGRPDDDVLSDITSAVRQRVAAAFGVRAERVPLARRGAIPKTSSGKIRRAETRTRYLAGELPLFTDDAVLTAGPADTGLAGRIAELARTVLEVGTGSIDDEVALTAVGLDSLRAVELRHLVREALGVDVPLRDLLAGANARRLADLAVVRAEEPGVEPTDELGDGERGLWLAARLAGERGHYALTVELDLFGDVDLDALDRTVRLLARRHPALRTYFPEVDGVPRRRPYPEELVLRVCDGTAGEVDRVVAERADEDVDPATGPLWRVTFVRADVGGVLVLRVHHMACDVWSLDLLAGELGEVYGRIAGGEEPRLPVAGDPARLVARHAALLAGERGRDLAAFWHDELSDLPPSAALPQARPHRRIGAPAERLAVPLPDAVLDQVEAIAREIGITSYAVLLTSFAWILHRYTAEHRFVLGMPASGRLDPESASAIGYFVNPLPLVCEIDPAEDFRDHLRRTGDRIAGAQAHQDYPYQRIVENCVPDDRGGDLIRILLLQQQTPSGQALSLLAGDGSARVRLGALDVGLRSFAQRTAPFELTVEVVRTTTGLVCSMTYDTDALTSADVEAFGAHWARLLARVTAEPDLRPGDVEILDAEERHQLVEAWHPRSTVEGPDNLVDAVLAVCARQPDRVAVRDGDGALTYAELDRRSAALASVLVRRGAVDERPVGLLLPRSADLVVAMIAALRAGSPYLPLDFEHPDPRLAAILADARCAVVVTSAELAATRSVLAGQDVVVEDPTAEPDLVPLPPTHPDRLAHLIYTSGSTGTPKGVACGHRGVVNLVADFQARVPIGPGDRCGWWTSPGFDVSVHEVFSALTAGATVEVCPPGARHDAHALMRWVVDRKITGTYLPPHLLPDVADWLADRPGDGRARLWLNWLLVGVEPIGEPLLRRITGSVPGLVVINGYGPTESTVWALFHEVDPSGTGTGITALGRGVANCPVHLLDEGGRPVPVGALGEIYIGGVALARGYHGRAGLTADRFVPSPFRPGERLYRTGDVARRRPDGDLVFVGRADHQAKVRGMRVEPREIETAMVEHPAVTSAVVVAEGAAPDTRLIGYARVATERLAEEALPADIARHLRTRLPGPMVPGQVVLVDEWPMTVNGKIDRPKLPRPDPVDAGRATPVGDVETAIAEVWVRLLRHPSIGRTDDFFALGGHSLLAVRVSAELSSALDLPVRPQHVMEHPTVAELGAALAALRQEVADDGGLDAAAERALLEHIAGLPAEVFAHVPEPAGGEHP
jgi:amino acid adenylation domain-containing protein